METQAKRTLVKSAPEIWELADDAERMQTWMGVLTGSAQPVAVSVTSRDAGRALAWRSQGAEGGGAIAIELAASGFGTAVEITAQHPGSDPGDAIAMMEGLLDELGAPERRPFA